MDRSHGLVAREQLLYSSKSPFVPVNKSDSMPKSGIADLYDEAISRLLGVGAQQNSENVPDSLGRNN